MATLVKRNGSLLPSLVNDFFSNDLFPTPGILDLDGEMSRFAWANAPSVNIVENDRNFKIELAVPGLEKKDFKIEVDNGILTISSEQRKEEKEEKENYRRREFSYRSFSRSFDLPENSLPEKIDAHYENGVLTLTLPKKEVTISKPRKEIKIS